MKDPKGKLFDEWPEKYDLWFETPIGALVKNAELEVILDLLRPARGERILDAGCGTGVFSLDLLSGGARLTGLDLSLPMLARARRKAFGLPFQVLAGDVLRLPFPAQAFDKAVSITALEFISDAGAAVRELFRVTRKGGIIVAATLNSLSPWADRRKEEAKKGHPLFQKVIFRPPAELASMAPITGATRTAVHFSKEENPDRALKIEREGRSRNLHTGAFAAVRWVKE
jgi:ubiquinone/menaquinone biosynthesis C-methylase UbiE